MADGDWWFDLKTKQVVQDTKAGKAADRLGPYPSRGTRTERRDVGAELTARSRSDPHRS